jgi:hypothetical protein
MAYFVNVDTPGLLGKSGKVRFVFANGSPGGGVNKAVVSNLRVPGGGIAYPGKTSGAVITNGTSYTLGDSNTMGQFANLEFNVVFGAAVAFKVDLSLNGPFGETPDAFQLQILNANGGELGTNGPTGSEAVVWAVTGAKAVPEAFKSAQGYFGALSSLTRGLSH